MRYLSNSLDNMDLSRRFQKSITVKRIFELMIDKYEQQKWRRKKARSRTVMDCGLAKWYGKKELYFLTLTSSMERTYEKLTRDFEVFRKRFKRYTNEKMEYVAIKTHEGNGVLHIIFKGKWLNIGWIKENWFDIHKADQCYIRQVEYTGVRLRNYLIKYLQNQGRVSYSFSWFKRGFMGEIRKELTLYRMYNLNYKFNMIPLFCVNSFNRWFYAKKSPEIIHNYITQTLLTIQVT